VGGEKIFLVDETGRVLDDITAAALMLELALQVQPESTVIVPITMPNSFDTIAEWRKSKIIRINDNLQNLMQASTAPGILFATDGSGNFIWPAFQPVVDGMMAAAKLLENLAKYKMRISDVIAYLPRSYLAKQHAECPTEAKGRVMRRLNELYGARNVETSEAMKNIEGIKIVLDNNEWVHIAPDPELPHFTVIVEGCDADRASALADEYRTLIADSQTLTSA
jgi:mannose-1-phosphate guanylyltransferase/phosphomannomutase